MHEIRPVKVTDRYDPVERRTHQYSALARDEEWTFFERYVGRLFRRDVITTLDDVASQRMRHVDWRFIVYGSSVIQFLRPPNGFPFPRRPRDVDISLVVPGDIEATQRAFRSTEVRSTYLELVEQTLHQLGATIVDRRGFPDGDILICRKYSKEEIARRVEGAVDSAYIDAIHDLHVELEISSLFYREQIFPVRPSQNGGIVFENPFEVLGYKIARLLTPTAFEFKDLVDIFNLKETGVFNFNHGRDVLRFTALVLLPVLCPESPYEAFGRISPSKENIHAAAKRLSVRVGDAKRIMASVKELLEDVFPASAPFSKREEFGGLWLRDEEALFLHRISGRERPGIPSFDGPRIDVDALGKAFPSVPRFFPGALERVARSTSLNKKVLQRDEDLRLAWM